MESIEIEYLDEYKDLVLPGINTNSATPATTLDNQAVSRSQRRRISSDSSGSSSIDADIFQKLFDGKFIDDDLLNESAPNVKGRSRNLSSSSSDASNDALDALFNRQTHKIYDNKRRERLESFDSTDDLGEALMGSNHKLSLSKSSSNSSRKPQSLHKATSTVKSKSSELKTYNQNASSSSSVFNARDASLNGTSSSSSSSNRQLQTNQTKKPVTIIKAQKPDLKPSKHEPKKDPLHLQDLPCDSDSDSSYVYESDFYGYDDSDEDDGAGSKQIIDISTDTSVTTSMAETVTPVVSEDESQQPQQSDQQHQQQALTPSGKNERLQIYLNNLSAAETPPSKHKHSRSSAKKSYSNEKIQSDTQVLDSSTGNIGQTLAEGEQQLEAASSSTTSNPRRLFEDSNNLPPADYVDDNLTYETLERLSHNLAEQIISIDAERSIEFEKRSGSKPRSNSVSQPTRSSLSVSHVRKLTYSNEALNTAGMSNNKLRRAKSEGTFPKGKRGKRAKKRADTTEEPKINISLTPKKSADKTDLKKNEDCTNMAEDVVEPVLVQESAQEAVIMTVSEPLQEPVPESETLVDPAPVPVKKKRGRPRKIKQLDATVPLNVPVSVELPKQIDIKNEVVEILENKKLAEGTQAIEISLEIDKPDSEKVCKLNSSDENQNNSENLQAVITIAGESITSKENLITGSIIQPDLKCTNNNSEKNIVSTAKERDHCQRLDNLQEIETQEADKIVEMSVVDTAINEENIIPKVADIEGTKLQVNVRTENSIPSNKDLADKTANSCESSQQIAVDEIIVKEVGVDRDELKTSQDNKKSTEVVSNLPENMDIETLPAEDLANVSNLPENMGMEVLSANELPSETFSAEALQNEVVSHLTKDLGIETRSSEDVTNEVGSILPEESSKVSAEDLPDEPTAQTEPPSHNIETKEKIPRKKNKAVASKAVTGRRSRSRKHKSCVDMESPSTSSPALIESDELNDKVDVESKNVEVATAVSTTEQKLRSSKKRSEKKKDKSPTIKKPHRKKPKLDILEKRADLAVEANNEVTETIPHPASTAEERPLDDNQTNGINPKSNNINESSSHKKKRKSRSKQKSKSGKSKSKKTKKGITESNLDAEGDKPILSDLPSSSQEQASIINNQTVDPIDIQDNVASNVKSRRSKSKNAKKQSKQAELANVKNSDVPQTNAEPLEINEGEPNLIDSNLINENVADSKISTQVENNPSEPNVVVGEQQDIDDDSESIKLLKPRLYKEIKEVQPSEGRTTRSRAGTPAAQRYRSREKETPANTGKERDKKRQVSKASVSRKAAKSKKSTKNLPEETDDEVISSMEQTEMQADAEIPQSLDRLTPINLGPSFASTPSTSSSTNSVRKLRVLVKKSKMLSNLEQKGANRASSSLSVDAFESKAASDAIVQPSEDNGDGSTGKDPNLHDISLGENELVDVESIEPETTGVHGHYDDGVSSKQTDDSESDGGSKSKHLMQAKSSMAPPAMPQRNATSSQTGNRRPFNASDRTTSPPEKRRKVDTKASEKPKPLTSGAHQKKGLPFVSPKQVSPVLSKKPEALTSPVKSTLSSLLGGDDSPTLNDSVIITKTVVGSPSEPFKRVEPTTSPATTSSEINISVSVVPDTINQPKKKMTQAATAKKTQLTTKQSSTVNKSDTKSLTANKSRKSEAEKRSNLTAKAAAPLIEEKPTLQQPTGKKSMLQAEKKKKVEKPDRKSMLANMLDTEPLSTEASTSSQAQVAAAAATAALATAKPEKKSELQKTSKKGVGKAKAKDLVEAQQQLEILNDAPASTETSAASTLSRAAAELAKEPTKRMSKKQLQKRDLSEPALDRVASSASRESSSERVKRGIRTSKAQGTNSELQRQPKKIQKLSNEAVQLPIQQPPQEEILQELEIEKPLEEQPPQKEQPKKHQRQQPQQPPEKPQITQGRKRKLPVATSSVTESTNAKRAKQQSEKPSTSIAFPVRITAASVTQPALVQTTPIQPYSIQVKPVAELPAVQKTSKLRVRINRSVVDNWVKQQQQQQRGISVGHQMDAPSQSTATPALAPAATVKPTTVNPPPVLAPSLPPALPTVSRQPKPANVLPLPVMEVKEEQDTMEEQHHEAMRPQVADRQEAPLQVVAPIPRTVSNPVGPVCSSSNLTAVPTRNNLNVANSSVSTTEVPVASDSNDVSTFGATKMFSFLYPSRYQRAYGQVGLDFCCPNLNGPMQAIDPTRLHSKAEVPVLELPQYMVISTKIFSKQDKNIPQKVRAKLEQMAAKEGQPCVVQSVHIAQTDVQPTPIVSSVPASTPVLIPAPISTSAPSAAPLPGAAPALGHIERLAKPLSLTLPRSALLSKKSNPAAAAVAPNVASSPAIVQAAPAAAAAVNPLAGLLQLPPICPADKRSMELQTRVQVFDLMLQNLAKSVISMTVSERQHVIENFVRKSNMQPIDVEVGTKLLENYMYHLNVTPDNVTAGAIPNLRPTVAVASTPSVTPQATNTIRKPLVSAVGAAPVINPAETSAYSRPIYDRSRNVIGYEYKRPRPSSISSTSSTRNPQQQQTPMTMTPSIAASSKVS
ncbi:hypothetical protein KR093_001356 [Drosophila rubida]|uniref:Uncharacterized protein n=1 Tax=Drosophila rubida TaxID=30044 RepID=A0AAD4JXP9_9MUSC|nr:hypothetical protein KR093_001356 [Drosophila rubida]